MTEIWIYGASDDLIEIEGDIREEFMANYPSENGTFLEVVFPTLGHKALVKVEYGHDANWYVEAVGGGVQAPDHYGVGEHDYKDYSEALHFDVDAEIEVRKVDE